MIRSKWMSTFAFMGVVGAGCSTAQRDTAVIQHVPPSTEQAALPLVREPEPITAGQADDGDGVYADGTDVLHYEVELAVDDASPVIYGDARLTLIAESGMAELDLTGLAVTEVLVDGTRARFQHRAGKLRVAVPGPPATADVRVRYRGTPDDGLIWGETVHGDPSVFADNWPNRARFWFPSVDHPSDKATVRFRVHAPAGWEVISNGRLEDGPTPAPAARLSELGMDPAPSAHRTWTWHTGVALPAYTMVIGATTFARRIVGQAACGRAPAAPTAGGCVEVGYWVFPNDTAHAARVFARSAEMVDYFTDLVGDYPYEKLINVQSSTRFGGMENASAIFYAEQPLSRGADIEGTVSHEIAHQWFGDSVTERDWSHLWLSEGFATYFGALFFEHADGQERFREIMERNRARYVQSGAAAQPVIQPDSDLFRLLNANNYQKGGWVLHMLRAELGDSLFFAGIRRYYESYRDGTALTDDLRTAMEVTSNRELGGFFEQWLERPGHPVFEVSWDWEGRTATVDITQVQEAAWPTFRVPMQVEVRSGNRSVRVDVLVDSRATRVEVPVTRRPTEVILDPDGWVLKEVR